MNNIKTVTLASAAALFALATVSAAPAFAAPAAGSVHCFGVNSCKGQGFKDMSASACTSAGGKTSP
jgi:hypothetical protein